MGCYYKKLFVRKTEIIKSFLAIILLICCNPVRELFVKIFSARYGQENLGYFMRILLIVQIITSHMLDWVEKICTRFIFLKAGKITADLKLNDIKDSLEDVYKKLYFDSPA